LNVCFFGANPGRQRNARSCAGPVRLFDPATGKQVETLAGAHPEGLGLECDSTLLTAAYSPDGKLLAAAGKLVKAGAFAGQHIGAEVCVWNALKRLVERSERSP
jgi:hypothetical protein